MNLIKFILLNIVFITAIFSQSKEGAEHFAVKYLDIYKTYNFVSMNSGTWEKEYADQFFTEKTYRSPNPGPGPEFVYYITKYRISKISFDDEYKFYRIRVIMESPMQLMVGDKVSFKAKEKDFGFAVGYLNGRYYIELEPTPWFIDAKGLTVLCEWKPKNPLCKYAKK
ncbi:hypothetical protein HGB47_16930 [Leptospira yasudae]|uniref:hypothetical protein n=1 Tax=Leptospira yasudae TaxID=2202201 RepID=UPI001C4FCFE5|nr:hypothetical protein [Leptospira yasudae]MBW0435293.1 hypothetical protein [Leptospira yasudae]